MTPQTLHAPYRVHAIQAHTTIKKVGNKRMIVFHVRKGLLAQQQVQTVQAHAPSVLRDPIQMPLARQSASDVQLEAINQIVAVQNAFLVQVVLLQMLRDKLDALSVQ